MHSWRRANEDWEIRFYDDEACAAFVAREFPEYLDAYRGLAKHVERSDFFRCARRCLLRRSPQGRKE
jgi:mannosyltransferase OCH1-like enzyme